MGFVNMNCHIMFQFLELTTLDGDNPPQTDLMLDLIKISIDKMIFFTK